MTYHNIYYFFPCLHKPVYYCFCVDKIIYLFKHNNNDISFVFIIINYLKFLFNIHVCVSAFPSLIPQSIHNKINEHLLRQKYIIKYFNRISEGSPEAYLPLIHYVCVSFSRFLARFLASRGYELVGKNDMRFMVCILIN